MYKHLFIHKVGEIGKRGFIDKCTSVGEDITDN